VFLAQHADRVSILVRGPGLAATMSRYLIDRIDATANIELRPHTELTALHGDTATGLERVSWRDKRAGRDENHDIRNVFLFVGAEPETEWLKGCDVAVDTGGFVRTGRACGLAACGRDLNPLETNVPGVFAVGDVRSGSVKRVGGAIGEGAAVVAQIHQTLAARVAA
jgi:thioredoxin reductase (NADPH)